MTPSPDPWLDYSGPLCDDPAERVGEPYVEVEPEWDWADLSLEQRRAATPKADR